MRVTVQVRNEGESNVVQVTTGAATKALDVPAKAGAPGSSVNGGEFLMLALATCFCNDVYREAARLGIHVDAVEVEATADFEGVGLAAKNVCYRARIASPAPRDQLEALLRHTDSVAEVQNTIRAGVDVGLVAWETTS